MSKYYLITFGCQMNKSDSERVRAVFEHLNYSEAESMEYADYVVINACSVRQAAIDRIWGLIKEFEGVKKHKKLKTILTGCLLPEDKEKFGKRFDLIFNIKDLSELEQFLHQKVDYTSENYFQTLPQYSERYRAFVPIMTGCNNYCSYCAVPYVRGREESRAVKDILDEVKKLADNGCKEIQLLGQNVNSYNPGDKESYNNQNPYQQSFAKLLWEVNQIDGIKRIFFTSAHPKDMHDDLIQAVTLPKMVNYIHFALQSGDDQILKAMNRKYTVEDYWQIIKKLRKAKPGIAIGTDIIVGFPGESREQFENTLDFYKKVKFDISYNAMYSPRTGTKAAELEDNVPQEEKKKRWHELQEIMEQIAFDNNQKYVEKTVSVLIDKVTDECSEGNSLEMKRVRINKKLNQGDIIEVKIKEAKEWMLYA